MSIERENRKKELWSQISFQAGTIEACEIIIKENAEAMNKAIAIHNIAMEEYNALTENDLDPT